MHDFRVFRQSAIKYWERKRILYNLALVPTSLFAYLLTGGLLYVGDPHPTLYGVVFFWFAISALGANVCFSLAYALEFLLGSDDPASRWWQFGRTTAFVTGLLVGVLLSLVGGWNIAQIEFYEQVNQVH